MKRVLVASAIVVGCSPTVSRPPEVVPVVVVAEPPPPSPPVVQAKAETTPVAPEPFRFSNDAVGKLLTPAAPPVPDVSGKAKPRPRPAFADSSPLSPVPVGAVPRLPTVRRVTQPTPPRERVPVDLGIGIASAVPETTPVKAGPMMRSQPVPALTAADVPAMAKQLPDRVPTDDPTAEISVGRIVNTPLAPTGPPPAVLRPSIPDPDALKEQMKPRQ